MPPGRGHASGIPPDTLLPVRRRCIAAVAVTLSLTACEEHTVAIEYRPEPGDEYVVGAQVESEIVRTVDGETDVERNTSRLDAVETVTAVDDDEVAVEVTVERDGSVPRTYEVRFDPTGHLSTIDLVEGVPAETLGIGLTTDLPADISSPPTGRLEPGATWTIERVITSPDRDEAFTVTGTGHLTSLGVVDGTPIGTVVVEVSVPLHSVMLTDDGRVTVRGTQTVRSRTSYDLDEGTARGDTTDIRGDVDVLVEPPEGVDAPPVPGTIRYVIETQTRRAKAG